MKTYNILVVTHNSRLRNLLRTLDPTRFSKPHRFKNCAILKLTIELKDNPNSTVTELEDPELSYFFSLELIHEGELTESPKKGKTYYDKSMNNVYVSNNIYVSNNMPKPLDQKFINITHKNEKKTYNIYLVRHGEGVHNNATKWTKFQAQLKSFINMQQPIKDALLTTKGLEQAQKAAMALYKHLNYNKNLKIDYVFASRLRRAFTTAAIFINSYHIYNIGNNILIKDDIIILPCSHELTGANDRQMVETLENRSICADKKLHEIDICNPNKIIDQIQQIQQIEHPQTQHPEIGYVKATKGREGREGREVREVIEYKINWDLFDTTFNNSNNRFYNRPTERTVCTGKNMIQFLINYIHPPPNLSFHN